MIVVLFKLINCQTYSFLNSYFRLVNGRPLFQHNIIGFGSVTVSINISDFYKFCGRLVAVLRAELSAAGGVELQDGGGIARA